MFYDREHVQQQHRGVGQRAEVELNSSNHRHSSRVNQSITASAPRTVPPYGIDSGTTGAQDFAHVRGVALAPSAKAWASISMFEGLTVAGSQTVAGRLR
jgi:hypothetical protein